MTFLNLLIRNSDGFIGRISSYELNGRYDLVKKWLEDDCKKEIESIKKVIISKYLQILEESKIPIYKSKLKEAEKIKDSINVEILEEIDLFVNGGLDQEIEDSEGEMLSKPKPFLELLKKRMDDMYQNVGVVDGYKNNVMNLARTKKNEFYDNVLIKSIDKIRNIGGKKPVSIEINAEEYPKEKTYEETKKVIQTEMKTLIDEGESFFKNSPKIKKVTFSFYKEIIKKNGNIDWDNCKEEMNELIEVKLIKIKVEV